MLFCWGKSVVQVCFKAEGAEFLKHIKMNSSVYNTKKGILVRVDQCVHRPVA